MDGRPFIDATTIGVVVALVVVVVSILASRRKPAAPPLPRGDGIIVLECVQLEEHSRTAAAAAASTRWIRCHGSFGANIKAVRSIPKASADATYGAILLIEPLRQFEALGAAVAVEEVAPEGLAPLPVRLVAVEREPALVRVADDAERRPGRHRRAPGRGVQPRRQVPRALGRAVARDRVMRLPLALGRRPVRRAPPQRRAARLGDVDLEKIQDSVDETIYIQFHPLY